MKAGIDKILQRAQAEYLDTLLPSRDPLLARIEQFAAKGNQPIADPEVAQVMRILITATGARHLVEVGTNIGYSVIVMGRAAGRGAVLETIELDRGILQTAKDFVAEAQLECEVRFHQGAALTVLLSLTGPFDFAFIDCVKSEYGQYLDHLLPKMKQGALIVCDNLLWGGKVADGVNDESTNALREFNRRITTDDRLTTSILPLGDGVGVSLVK
jgi:predicted O-methyltransferase YrrM